MVYSTKIDDLRKDVAANCRVFVAMMKAAGYSVKIVNTVRDAEKQLELYNQGYSTAKTPSFHSVEAGLAFDICKNSKKDAYGDEAFWRKAGEIGKRIGFTWGGDWKSFMDKPHFQWDAHGKYSGSMVRSGNYPPDMPLFETEEDEVRYKYLKEVPAGEFQDTIEKLMNAGIVNGDGSDPIGNNDVIDLSHDMVRMMVFEHRAGAYDKKLMKAGLPPAVRGQGAA